MKIQVTNATNCLVAICAKTNDLLRTEYMMLQEELHKLMPNAQIKPGYYPFTDYQVENGVTVVLIVSGSELNYRKNYIELNYIDYNSSFTTDSTTESNNEKTEKPKTKTIKGSLPDYL